MHLQSRQDYIDRYDKTTVDFCRMKEKSFEDRLKALDPKETDYDAQCSSVRMVYRYMLWYEKGERALAKEKTVNEWMEKDRHLDYLEESIKAPMGIHCLHCGSLMDTDFKTLADVELKRFLFFYDCPNKCLPRRCFYDNGEEWFSKPDPCAKCGSGTTHKTIRKGRTITTTLTCHDCKHVSSSSFKMHEKEQVSVDTRFEEDRARFCFNQAELDKFISEKRNLEELVEFMKKHEDSDKMKKIEIFLKGIKTLNLAGLKLLLQQVLKVSDFTNFNTADPSKGYRGISINFTARDERADRDERAAKKTFKDAVNAALRDTNWRLLESTVEASLGLITSRIKGYQNQSELREVIEKEVEEGKIDIKSIELKKEEPGIINEITL